MDSQDIAHDSERDRFSISPRNDIASPDSSQAMDLAMDNIAISEQSASVALGKRKRDNSVPCNVKEEEEEEDDQPLFISVDSSDDEVDEESLNSDDEAYEDTEQPLPAAPIYHRDVDELKLRLDTMIRGVQRIFAGDLSGNRDLRLLEEKLEVAKEISWPKPVNIALIGDAGVGKSCFINSIIGIPKLAKEGATGRSCTCVPVQYHAEFAGQEQRFLARVHYFDATERLSMMESLLDDYYEFYFNPSPKWTREEERDHKANAETAFSIFNALFCEYNDFESPGHATQHLQWLWENSTFNHATSKLTKMCTSLLLEKPMEFERTIEYIGEDSVKRYRAAVDPFMSSTAVRKGSAALWPLVMKIEVGITKCDLLKNLQFTDLPGISDTNKLRVKTSLACLDQADALWLVGRIDRVVDNNTIDSLLQDYRERFTIGRIAVICTRSDEIFHQMDDLAVDMEAQNQSLGDYVALTQESMDIGRIIKQDTKLYKQAVRKEKAVSRRKIRNAKVEQMAIAAREDCATIGHRIRVAERKKNALDSQRFFGMVDIRNNYVRAELNSKWGHDKAPIVFCVSNLHHAAQKHHLSVAGPILSTADTGIPEVRAYALELPAPAMWHAFVDHIKINSANVQSAIGLWAGVGTVEDPSQLQSIVMKPQTGLHTLFATYMASANEKATDRVMKPITRSHDTIADSAIKYTASLSDQNWRSLWAFIRKNGDHVTKLIPKRSWNRDWMEGAVQVLDVNWEQMLLEQNWLLAKVNAHIMHALDEVLRDIGADLKFTCIDLSKLEDLVGARKLGVAAAFRAFRSNLGKEMSVVKHRATKNTHDGYFASAMAETYEEAKLEKGTGYKIRVLAKFNERFTPDDARSAFHAMVQLMCRDIEKNIEQQVGKLQRKTKKILDLLARDFEGMVKAGSDPDPATIRTRERVMVYLENSQGELDAIKQRVAEIEAESSQ